VLLYLCGAVVYLRLRKTKLPRERCRPTAADHARQNNRDQDRDLQRSVAMVGRDVKDALDEIHRPLLSPLTRLEGNRERER
jgi:hypothetical protein